MYDGEAELALRQVLAVTLVLRVLGAKKNVLKTYGVTSLRLRPRAFVSRVNPLFLPLGVEGGGVPKIVS